MPRAARSSTRTPCFFALDRNKDRGRALDVFENEPLDLQSPLRGLGDKVLVSPHMVSANKGASLEPAVPWAINAAMTALRGEVPRHVVNERDPEVPGTVRR